MAELTSTVLYGNLSVTGSIKKAGTEVSVEGHTHAWSAITSKPTTISGYGITDAKIANGVITLGSNTITPLTSHQTVSNKGATLSWGTAITVATIGSTDINVSLPANPNTDTKNTAGTTEKASTKLFLVGASSQADNPQTYSNQKCYVGTDNCLYSNGTIVSVSGHTHSYAGSSSAGGAANSVAKSLTLKIKTGSTEGTDKYTFDGSGAKTLDIKEGSNISLTVAAGSVTIANTYSYTHPSDGGNTGNFGPSASVAPGSGGTFSVPYITVNSAGHVTAASTKTITMPTVTDTKNTAGSTNSTSTLYLIGATSQAANPQTYSNSNVTVKNGTLNALALYLEADASNFMNFNPETSTMRIETDSDSAKIELCEQSLGYTWTMTNSGGNLIFSCE